MANIYAIGHIFIVLKGKNIEQKLWPSGHTELQNRKQRFQSKKEEEKGLRLFNSPERKIVEKVDF